MKSMFARLAATAFAAVSLVTAAQAEDKVVNIYNWSDYIDDSILADFTKETGIKVVYDIFDSNETLETKLLAGGTGYDVVVPTADFLQRQIEAGVFQKLDKSKLPNLSNMWDMVMQRIATYDPGNRICHRLHVGHQRHRLQRRQGEADPRHRRAADLDVIFDPKVAAKFKDCGIYMLDAPKDVIPTALAYLGLDPNSTKPEDFKKAETLLTSIRPFVRKFHSSEYINALANGDICIAFGYSGDIFQARDRAAEAKNGVDGRLFDPVAGRADVVRRDGDSGRRAACRRGA